MKYCFNLVVFFVAMYASSGLLWVSVPAMLPEKFNYSMFNRYNNKKGKEKGKSKTLF